MGMNTRYVKEYFYKEKIRSVFAWIVEIAAAILLAGIFSWFFCKSVVVQEGSMDRTLTEGERVLVDSAAYRIGEPQRGDIIVFRTSEDKKASLHIKRVIALPGETVQIVNGQIMINGETYLEGKDFPSISNAGLAEEPITLGKKQYFVLGDNRNNSEDSRHSGLGMVDSDLIEGKLWFVISPWDKIGFPDN